MRTASAARASSRRWRQWAGDCSHATKPAYRVGTDEVAIALNPVASEFRQADGLYLVGEERLTSAEMVERYAVMVAEFGVRSMEDGRARTI